MSEDKKKYRIEEKPDMADWEDPRVRARIFTKSKKETENSEGN